jgi:hypothetical protein
VSAYLPFEQAFIHVEFSKNLFAGQEVQFDEVPKQFPQVGSQFTHYLSESLLK